MAELNQTSANPAGGSAATPMANPVNTSAPASSAPPVHAQKSVLLFGGNASGKKRADGLKPGSPAAIEADKAKDRERKRRDREARAAAAEPPPLGSAPAGNAMPGASQAPGGDFPPDNVVAFAAVAAWEADKLKPLTDQLIGLVEDLDVSSFSKTARAGALPEKVIKKIECDSEWPRAGKLMLERSTPKLAAKWMNKTGLSAEFQDEMEFMGGCSAILISRQKLMKELRAMIEDFKAAAPPATEKKP